MIIHCGNTVAVDSHQTVDSIFKYADVHSSLKGLSKFVDQYNGQRQTKKQLVGVGARGATF